jgi:two-component system, NtrC family, response regulator AtoC
MSIEKVLIVDDELLIRNFLAETLQRKQFDVSCAENGKAAFKILKKESFDLVITDMKMPDYTGIEVLKKVKELSPNTLVIIVTAFGSIENSVEAMRLGAFNYLIKPFSPDTIEAVIEKAQEHLSLVEENKYLREQISPDFKESGKAVIAESPSMKKILDDVQRVAKSNANVFVNGESGTGKEVIAHAIHHFSPRISSPYVKVNCAAIPETLIESEFFGHEKGSFTGAHQKRLGRFELAHKGTLLLDEITEVPISLQAKLLRVIQEQEFERVGGSKPINVDVRIVSTSNRNMEDAIRDQIFREDLFYRLNVIPIHIPPLRQRVEDILPLTQFFLEKFCFDNHQEIKTLSPSATQKLLEYQWPGNIRELANVIERVVVMDYNKKIEADHLWIQSSKKSPESTSQFKGMTLQELEKARVIEAISENKSKKLMAESLGVTVSTLNKKIKSFNIEKKE